MKGISAWLVIMVGVMCFPVQAQTVTLNGKPMASLGAAMKQAKDGSIISLSEGDFKQAGVLSANNVIIHGQRGKTRIHGAVVWGKGALVIRGQNTTVENIECFDISVPSHNGACIRLDGKNLEVKNVYFHDAEQGILTGRKPGHVVITNSRFERLGKGGQAHGIYIGGGTLLINRSYFIGSKEQGHEVKSRAKETTILRSVIATQKGHDSRLIDISNGGKLEIKDSILQQGNSTSNSDMIGFGLEGYKYPQNHILLVGNIFLMDRDNGSIPLHIANSKVIPQASQNVFVGKMNGEEISGNIYVADRAKAGLPPAPELPPLQ